MSAPAISIRPLQADDLAAALTIQSRAYPSFLVEDADAFAGRIEMAASFCLAAMRDGVLVGYLLAHGWSRRDPPSLGLILPRSASSEVLFIHDLAVAPAGRGMGLGQLLVARAFKMAAAQGLRDAELVAVEGAATYWQALGFAEVSVSADLALKVAAYGSEARWMTRSIPTSADLQEAC